MSANTAAPASRTIMFGSTQLEDPGPEVSNNELLKFYSEAFPQLNNGSVDVKDTKGKITVTLKAPVGTKG